MASAEFLLSSSNGGRVPVGRRYSVVVVWGGVGQETPRLLLRAVDMRSFFGRGAVGMG